MLPGVGLARSRVQKNGRQRKGWLTQFRQSVLMDEGIERGAAFCGEAYAAARGAQFGQLTISPG
jgi:hypothetical protein